VQALVRKQLERLVGDLREAKSETRLRRAPRRVPARGDRSLRNGTKRVDDDDQGRAVSGGDVEIGGGDDPAVDQLAARIATGA